MFSKLQKNIASIKGRFIKSLVLMTPALLAFQNASAQLPRPVDPSSGPSNGNYMSFMQGWTADAVEYVALAVSGAGFLWVSWILLSKFNEARQSNDPDWGSVGLTAVIAGALLAIVSFFLNEATGIL